MSNQTELDKIYSPDNKLAASFREQLLPYHFVAATLSKIGGKLFAEKDCFGYVLPGKNLDSGTVRYYGNRPVLAALDNSNYYDVEKAKLEDFAEELIFTDAGIKIVHPDKQTAIKARLLQKQIWGITDDSQLYPVDLYHPHSGLATRLVAKSDADEVQGFLFGFYGKGKTWLGNAKENDREIIWIESQLLGVDQSVRKTGIAKLLKITQLKEAQADNIPLIHWTVDPLQFPNAKLNFNSLGAVAAEYYPDYYQVRNELNPLKTSRFGISWLTASGRVNKFIKEKPKYPSYEELANQSGVEVVKPIDENGKEFLAQSWAPYGSLLLIQIPINWTNLLKNNLQEADVWRRSSDRIFSKIIGAEEGKYIITGVVTDKDGKFAYLLTHKNEGKNLELILKGDLL